MADPTSFPFNFNKAMNHGVSNLLNLASRKGRWRGIRSEIKGSLKLRLFDLVSTYFYSLFFLLNIFI